MKTRIALTIILAIFICGPVSSQGRNKKKVVLTGKIVNRDSIPVKNVSIFLDGINTNVMSDSKGEFRLKFKPDVKKISFYSMNDGVFEIAYVGQERLEITMSHEASLLPNTRMLEDESVETGYGKTSKDDLVGSVSTITSDRFKNRSYDNIYDMIAGEATGVTVEGTTIRVRGITSLMGSNDPLLIVDGAPAVSLEHIAPNDVESINILKGSSTAIYGSRGAAGVVVITTKKGGKK
jgi:iron complex outermembrane receptor protein